MKEIKILSVVALLGVSGLMGYNRFCGETKSELALANMEALTNDESVKNVNCWLYVLPAGALDEGVWAVRCVPCARLEWVNDIHTLTTCRYGW